MHCGTLYCPSDVASVLGSGEGGSVGVCGCLGRLRDRQVISGKLQLLVQTLGISAP